MPVYNIHHTTRYEYDRPVKESVSEIRIYPFACMEQEVLFHDLKITGQPDVMTIHDYWGNKAGMFNVLTSHKQMLIESKLIVRTLGQQSVQQVNAAGFDELRADTSDNISLLELVLPGEIALKPIIDDIGAQIHNGNGSVMEVVEACSHYIFDQFQYVKGITNVETTVAEILEHRSGVCQDFAHVMLAILRNLQIPSRYVSGYICPDKTGMRGEGATHAWVEAWIPHMGWTGIDPTNNAWVTNHHVKLAVGRHFNDCSPIKGTFKGPARQSLSVSVSISYEDGHHFEEINNVQLEEQDTSLLPDLTELIAGQQQQ